MSLREWVASGWLRPHAPSRQEILDLLAVVDRDLRDAEGGVSADWRFGIAYNAALKLCTIVLHAEGYRAERSAQHHRTIAALPVILGAARRQDAEYLDTCRKKRNLLEYETAGVSTEEDAAELRAFVASLRSDVLAWLRKVHPEIAP